MAALETELGLQSLSLVGPLERLGHGVIEVVNELQQPLAQVVQGVKTGAPKGLSTEDGKPDFDLVEPRTVLGV